MHKTLFEAIAGDRQIKDLTPQTTNIGNRLVKNMRICGSGIYTYRREEAGLLHLTPVPESFKDLTHINVYRPAEVLIANKDKFARVPIITGRHVLVNQHNAKQLSVGMVGDTVDFEKDVDDGETYLYTTGTIVAGDGVEAYEKYGQLSVGYDPIIEWEEGVHKGVPYHAVLKGFNDINHLLICQIARGGPQCMVMDSLDEYTPLEKFINNYNGGKKSMGIFSKIFGSSNAKQVAGDTVQDVVPVLLQSIAIGADPETQVASIRQMMGDNIDKTFDEYLGELATGKGESAETLSRAVNIVQDYYKSLVGDEKTVSVEKKDKDGKETKNVEVKEDGKETKDIKVEKKDGEKKVEVEEDMNGDSLITGEPMEIDYDILADKIVSKMAASSKQEPVLNGDSVDELSMIIAGDSDNKDLSSDLYMKNIFGGK